MINLIYYRYTSLWGFFQMRSPVTWQVTNGSSFITTTHLIISFYHVLHALSHPLFIMMTFDTDDRFMWSLGNDAEFNAVSTAYCKCDKSRTQSRTKLWQLQSENGFTGRNKFTCLICTGAISMIYFNRGTTMMPPCIINIHKKSASADLLLILKGKSLACLSQTKTD